MFSHDEERFETRFSFISTLSLNKRYLCQLYFLVFNIVTTYRERLRYESSLSMIRR